MLPWKRMLRPLAAVLLTAALAVVPAATAHAAAPSSGWNDYTCKPSAAHPRPVVLVHGTFGNSVDNWLSLAPYLEDRGYCVYSLDYGQLPGVPVFDDRNSYYDPLNPQGSVIVPNTGTQIRIQSISAQGNFMQVQVRPAK